MRTFRILTSRSARGAATTQNPRSIGTNWRYVAVLNYYREISRWKTPEPIALETPLPTGRSLYVLFLPHDQEFAGREHLEVIYHDEVSDAAVAVRPQ